MHPPSLRGRHRQLYDGPCLVFVSTVFAVKSFHVPLLPPRMAASIAFAKFGKTSSTWSNPVKIVMISELGLVNRLDSTQAKYTVRV